MPTHLEHLEDLLFENRVHELFYVLEQFAQHFTSGGSDLHITTKWDGSPAIVCGTDKYNHFFVATKSAFNITPKLCYSVEDIFDHHPRSRFVQECLVGCLRYLPELNIKGILQGDLMYCQGHLASDLKKKDGSICFKPNIVEYMVPLNTDLGKHISESRLGIVFHTAYDITLTEADYRPDVGVLTPSKNVWFRDASLVNGIGPQAFFEQESYDWYANYLHGAKVSVNQISKKTLNTFGINETIKTLTKRFINAKIRDGEVKDTTSFNKTSLINFASGMFGEEIASAKKPETKLNRETKRDEVIKFLEKKDIDRMFFAYAMILECKNIILGHLNKMKDIETEGNLVEGYVASLPGTTVKLVDRPRFSYANFNAQKDW